MIFTVFFSLLVLAFLLRVITNTLCAVWLWQIKEYRFDRLLVHLRETKEGRRFLINPKTILFSLLFLASPLTVLDVVKPWYLVFATGVFVWDVWMIIKQIQNHLIRRPVWTVKAILIASLSFITLVIIFSSFSFWSVAAIVFVDRLVFPVVSILVLLALIPTMFAKLLFMEAAKRKIEKLGKLTVIGITGSYAKSSTKELIADFLSGTYHVLKTPGSVNTDLGIARFTLKELKENQEVFVVEIGAYKRGEIASVCNMLKPKIGVLTGINEQHLSLFGSLKNTKKAKFELIESLPEDGMALFNGDDPIVLETNKTLQVSRTQPARSTFVYSVKQLPVGIKAKKNPFLANVAAAYVLAQKLGVSEKLLQEKLAKILPKLGLKTLQKGNVTILDDSFNANPKGFSAALDVLATYKGKKVLVTPGIIELGNESYRIHIELGEKIGTICDVVILTNDNFEEPIREELMETKFDMRNLLVPKREELVDVVKHQLQGELAILLEGRMPSEIANLYDSNWTFT